MTIKQNGGIFGRNPTFNDVEIQGTLTTSGSVSQSGNFTVDTDTFVVDATNDRVGVNIALPTQALHVNGNIILNDGSFGPGDSHSVAIGDLNAFIKSTHGSPIAFGAYHGYTFNFASAGDLTTNGEWVRIDSDGLKFNGDTAAANALDDYEEGTWTPAITFSGGDGTGSWAYSTQNGQYTKAGNTVRAAFQIRLSSFSKGTASGTPRISGLPFNFGVELSLGQIGLFNASFSSQPIIVGLTGSAQMDMLRMQDNNVWAALNDPDADAQYFGVIVYQAS